jgi:hypothetical protein
MKIQFIPGTESIEKVISFPESSKKFIPNWYKDISAKQDAFNVKKCIPFLDALTHGYIQKTWADIKVVNNNESFSIEFDHDVEILKYREKSDLPMGDEFYNVEFIWQRPWSVVLPEGYSGLVTHPLNRIDLPFHTLSGIVDFDNSVHAPIGNIPFYIKKGFSGIIPTGTPMFQIIPIKRETWSYESKVYSDEFWESKLNERSEVDDFYKKRIWQKKLFD